MQCFSADSRPLAQMEWATSRPSFSFGGYFDPVNTSFGVMRVCNDDEIAAGKGFGPHPHSDMEIVTVVLSGAIRHQDNLGNDVVTTTGEVQRMTAGTGVIHAEYNASDTEPLQSLQLWFMPSERGLKPSFESIAYDTAGMANTLLPIVSQQGSSQVASIHQDMTIYLSKLDAGKELLFRQGPGRRVFMFVIEGKLSVNGQIMERRDTARMEAEPKVALKADEAAWFMLVDLP
jgi:redox-sensitive bicupin YhaK (pirin superfamily)